MHRMMASRRSLPALMFSLGSISVSGWWFHQRIAGWANADEPTVSARLWLILILSFIGTALLAALRCFQIEFEETRAILLTTLPLTPADRGRGVIVSTLREVTRFPDGVGVITPAVGLLAVSPVWCLALIIINLVAVLAGVAGLLFVLPILTRGSGRVRLASAIAVLTASLMMLAVWQLRDSVPPFRPPSPWWAAIGIVPCAAFVTPQLRTVLGRRYLHAVQTLQAHPGTANYSALIGYALPAHFAERWRTPTGAILTKELRAQGRDRFFLLRYLVIAAAPLIVFWLDRRVRPDLPGVALVAMVVAALLVYVTSDTTPSPNGSEGERIGLLLTAPVTPAEILVGKALAIAGPLVAVAFIAGALCGLVIGQGPLGSAAAVL